jgi:hypothetical protein
MSKFFLTHIYIMNTTQNKIESIKQVIEVMKELEDIDIELNKKCKQSGDNIDMLKQLVTESNKNLEEIVKNLL